MATVQRLSAIARLDDPTDTLARARADADAGDESWEQWVAEYRRGEAIIVRLEVVVEVGGDDPQVVTISNRGVFVEKAHPPKVEQQIAELAGKDFTTLARKLTDGGHEIGRQDLAQMYVHVELGEDVRRALADDGAAQRERRAGRPRSDARLAQDEEGG